MSLAVLDYIINICKIESRNPKASTEGFPESVMFAHVRTHWEYLPTSPQERQYGRDKGYASLRGLISFFFLVFISFCLEALANMGQHLHSTVGWGDL